MRLSHLCAFVAIATIVLTICQVLLEVYLNYEEPWLFPLVEINRSDNFTQLFEDIPFPVVVWWQSALRCKIQWTRGQFKQCGPLTCYFTAVEQFRHHPNFMGYLFYGSNINWKSLPLPRDGASVFWGLVHEESPRNNIPISHKPIISLFNYTSTFSRHSDVPTTSWFLSSLEALTSKKYFETVDAKNSYQKNESWLLAPVMYLQTDCSTPIDRDSYVVELSKHIRVDSYGLCLHNRDLPPHLQIPFTLSTMMSDDLLHIVGKYKFALAIENAVCEDYITEKLWRPLITGTVPIYIGSPTVADWLPNNNSAILGIDFESPKHLAEFLHFLDSHDEEYNNYLSHKLKSSITNSRLVEEIKNRDISYKKGETSYIDTFECFVCEKAHNRDSGKVSIATTEHYSCPMPSSILTQQVNVTNYWTDWWFEGLCEAEVVRQFVDAGVANYTLDDFNKALKELQAKNRCSYSEAVAREIANTYR